MKKSLEDISFAVERAYSAYTNQMTVHMGRIAKYREHGYLVRQTRHDFEFNRDLPLTEFKKFVAALPDFDGDYDIDHDGNDINIYFYREEKIADGEIWKKMREWGASVVIQFHHYLAVSHVLYFMRNNNMVEIEEVHYNALYYAHQLQLHQSNVTPDGYEASFEVTQ